MLPLSARKKAAALVVDFGSEPKMDEPKEEGAPSAREALVAISRELLDAIRADDADAVAAAFEAAFAHCGDEGEEE